MDELRAYCIDGVDTFIARDLEDLSATIQEHYGDSWEEMCGTHLFDTAREQLEPDKVLKIVNVPVEGETKTQTVAEWIAENGRGFLCSTEW